jgi:hypothetical protein
MVARRNRANVLEFTGDKLAELIAQRHACLTQMHKLGVKQSELVASCEISSLLRLLSVKNQLIVALQSIEQQLTPFQSQDPETRQWSSSEARERCGRQIAECQVLLDQVMQMERDNEQKMTERRDLVANQLQAARSATTARRAYQVHQRSTTRLLVFEPSDSATEQLDLHAEA